MLLGNILLICQPIRAQQVNRWQFVGRSDTGSSSYLDKSVEKQTGDIRRTWTKEVFSDGSYKIGLVDWQCRAKKFRILEGASYESSGKYIYREGRSSPWITVVPDSVSENYYRVVCRSTGQASPPESKSSENKTIAEVIALHANVRASPTADSPIVQRVKKGVRLTLAAVEPTNGWYQVFIPVTNETGWLYGSTIELLAAKSHSRQPRQKSKPTTHKRGRRAN